MAATLVENINGKYYQNRSVLGNRPNEVKVMVEDEEDVPFWEDVLSFVRPDKKFLVTPYSYASPKIALKKGKQQILSKARANAFNAYFIGCVDSDYDYLLQDYPDDGKLMASNRYLLQTYAYSIENLLCHAGTLASLCSKSVKGMPDFDFQSYMAKVSCIIRPLLLCGLYCVVKGYIDEGDFTATDWQGVFPCDEDVCKDDQAEERILGRLQKNVSDIISRLEANHLEMAGEIGSFEYEIFSKKQLSELSWLYDNCCFAVRGHDLHKFVLNTTLKGIAKQLKAKHLADINGAAATEEEKANNRNHYQNMIIDIEDLLRTNYEYKHKDCPLFKMIKRDIERVWDEI